MDRTKIKKVHVVYKTHLDIGFTDLGQNVLDRYVSQYIPHAIALAEQLNGTGKKKFIWTVGSFLIDYFLKNAGTEECLKLENAIINNDICWHGLSCTTHSELLDEDLFHYGLRISDRLDQKYGKHTIAAKMTDVPGHTRAVAGLLKEHGKEYLHIGVNASSMVPEIPDTFLWRGDKGEVVVQYSYEYGAPCYMEGMDEVLEFAHTADNMGPQSGEEIEAEFERLKDLYPNAVIEASTMDAYAQALLPYKDRMPVVTEEIGDTWIHGIGTDPLKITNYRVLLELKNRWKAEGRLCETDACYDEFMMNLLLIAEHTWGLDYKKYLADFTNWDKEDFQAARKADVTTLDFLTNRNAHMLKVLKEDFDKYRGGVFTGSYRQFEASHQEQREYLNRALKALPETLKAEAAAQLSRMKAEKGPGLESSLKSSKAERIYPGKRIKIGKWEAAFGGFGELAFLEKEGFSLIREGLFGRLVYSSYDMKDCVHNYYSYNRDFRETQCWSEGDFSKPGLEFSKTGRHREYIFLVSGIELEKEKVVLWLTGDQEAVQILGCPALAKIEYTFGEEILCRVSWFDKDANKMPEALWLDMNFDVENPYLWQMKKLNRLLSPLHVVRGGNRRQHCVEEMVYRGADGALSVKNIHSPLISIGGRWLYGDYRQLPDIREGFSYCLCNNKWGTNFKMWCEDDCAFEYIIKVSATTASTP